LVICHDVEDQLAESIKGTAAASISTLPQYSVTINTFTTTSHQCTVARPTNMCAVLGGNWLHHAIWIQKYF